MRSSVIRCIGVYFANVDTPPISSLRCCMRRRYLLSFSTYTSRPTSSVVLDYRAPLLLWLHKHLGGVVLRYQGGTYFL